MTGQFEKLVSGKSVKKAQRIQGRKYLDTKGEIAIWNGKVWKCEHHRNRSRCKECGGSSICGHGRERSKCKECGGASICEHGRERSKCKECGGSQICEHGRERSRCKECKALIVLAVQPLIVTASDVAFGDAADDTAISLALPPR